MEWEVIQSKDPEIWQADAWNMDGEGEGYFTEFSGHLARERAEEYAAFKNSQESNAAPK